jgi:hypothetical protein
LPAYLSTYTALPLTSILIWCAARQGIRASLTLRSMRMLTQCCGAAGAAGRQAGRQQGGVCSSSRWQTRELKMLWWIVVIYRTTEHVMHIHISYKDCNCNCC